ncbi:MAG: hypothetical protein EOP46_02685 [Sphingobacteriaceae bacterium]|nr:MAG: hypothetical protein EOP46_02685 [Sphingobacteriaceae bacterium]
MKKIILLFCASLCTLVCLAQTPDFDDIRFNMIKETVNFLATNKNIPKRINNKFECEREKLHDRYVCLEATITKESVGSASGPIVKLIRNLNKKETKNTAKDIESLKKVILESALEIDNRKISLKDLDGYSEFKNQIESLAPSGGASGSVKVEDTKVDNNEGSTETGRYLLDAKVDVLDKRVEKLEQADSKNYITYIAIVFAFVSLILSFLAFKKKKQHTSLSHQNNDNSVSSNELNRVDDELRKAQVNIGSLTAELESLRQELKKQALSLRNQHAEADAQKRTETEQQRRDETDVRNNPEPVQPKSVEADVQTNEIIFDDIKNNIPAQNLSDNVKTEPFITTDSSKKYAKYSDLEQGGFSAGILQDAQNGEQTFEISILGDIGAYQVANDLKAQNYALQSYEYLSEACIIKGTPQVNKRIYNIKQGNLSLSAEGDWIIVTKAEIEIR